MSVRLAFAVAAHLEPEILLVDEVLAVGDAEFQRRCLGRMEDLSDSGRTVVFVSHQMQAVAQLCDRAIWLDKGVRRARRAERRRRRPVPAGRSAVGLDAGRGPTSRPRPGTTSCACGRSASSRTARSHAASTCASRSGSRSGSRCSAADDPPIFPKIKVYDSRGDVVFNAMDTSPRWHEPSAPGDYISTAWIPGEPPQRGAHDRRRGVSLARRAEAASACAGERRRLASTSRTPARATRRAVSSPGSGRASSARCSTGRPRSASPCKARDPSRPQRGRVRRTCDSQYRLRVRPDPRPRQHVGGPDTRDSPLASS